MRSFILLISLCLSGFLHAQETAIKGTITDENRNPLSLVNLSLIRIPDSTLVSSALSEKDGSFSLPVPPAGNYRIRFSSIGFSDYYSEVFEVNSKPVVTNLGIIVMRASAKSMENVTVSALRPQIIQKADKMIVSVEGTALAAGSTAFDVLSRSPGVFIDQEGNIQLNGRAGVTVMIDGKLTYLTARELRSYLEAMSAENIKNIEIITNPSAKFDAEGASGILNINLKKNELRGMNGSVYASTSYNMRTGYAGGGNINYKAGKWNTFLNLDLNKRVGGRNATFTRIFYGPQKTIYFDQVASGDFTVQGPPTIKAGIDYSLNNMHSIGVMTNITMVNVNSDFLTQTYIGNSPTQPQQFVDADNFVKNRHRNYNMNFHYQGKLDTVGTTLSADVDFVRISNKSESDFFNYFTDLSTGQVTTDFLYTNIPSSFDILSGKFDFARNLGKETKVEAGAKASSVVSDNDSRFYFNNSGLVEDPLRTNHFKYRENIYAGYVNLNTRLSKMFTVQAGLRAENTVSKGSLLTTNEITERNYLDFFPSFFVQQNISDNYQVNYNYSRRLARPNYGNLNPFLSYRDPYTWWQGNPYLRPQYTHSFGITQTIKKSYNLTFSYQLQKDVISELPRLDVNNATTVYYIGNVNDANNISLTAIAPVKIMRKWETQNTFILAHHEFNMVDNNRIRKNEQLFWMLQSNHTILLPGDLKMEINTGYRGPAAYGLYQIDAQHWVHLGFKKSFMNKKLDVSLNANDLFKGQRLKFTTDIDGNVNDFDQYFRNRNIGLTVRYHFSKGQKIESNNRNRTLEELNRTN